MITRYDPDKVSRYSTVIQSYYTGMVLSPHVTQLGWYERQEITKSSKLLDEYTWLSSYYKCYREPNYPTPAIPMVVDIEPNYVVWFEWRGPKMMGDYVECVKFYP